METQSLTYVLVHGAWHTGSVWKSVGRLLERDGHTVHAPTLKGFGPDADAETSMEEAAESLSDYIIGEKLRDVVLLGWSLGGVSVSLAAPKIRKRLRRLVFHSAIVPRNGQTVYDALPLASRNYYRSLLADGTVALPFDKFRDLFAPEVDSATAKKLYDAHLHPQVEGMFNSPVDMTAFDKLIAAGTVPTTYINAPDDSALINGRWGWYPRFAHRVGVPRVVHLHHAGHEAPLTAPKATASAYVKAGRD